MTFKNWLESEDKGYEYYRNLLLGKLNLDRTHGASQSLDTWNPESLAETLNGLGEFRDLPKDVQSQVFGQIQSGTGTLDDLIQIMAQGN